MATNCASLWLVRMPKPPCVLGRASRTGFLNRAKLPSGGLGFRGGPLERLRGLNLIASVKPEAETAAEEAEKAVMKVDLEKDISKVVRKTAATFAPRSSTAKNKNPAQPGTTLYSIFESQAYISMLVGGILSFNLLFPSDHPDIWRLMGMWSVWMFTIPSLRARDCPAKEKEALNYLFLVVPLINVTLPLLWKSFAAVWSADVIAFFAMYAWKVKILTKGTTWASSFFRTFEQLEWLGGSDNKANDSEQ